MSEFGDLNAVGQPREVGRMGSMGGNDGRGAVDQVLPTGIVSRGNEVKAADVANKGQRKGMSVARNEQKARMRMSER